MSKRFRLARRGVAVALVFAVVTPVFAVLALGSAPAGAVAIRPAARRVAVTHAAAYSVAKKPKKKPAKKKAKGAKVTAAKGHLSSRDYVEIALLAISPFVVVGLFLVGSESRRRKPALAES
jgi:hypothetical protein